MATFERRQLSGSTNGRPIPVAASATPGTLIHTAPATGMDELTLYVSNVTGTAATLTLEWGGTTDPGDHLVKAVSIPANSGPIEIATKLALSGGLIARAFSATASALNITGAAVRITP